MDGHHNKFTSPFHASPATFSDRDQSISGNYLTNTNDMSASAIQVNVDSMNRADEKRVLAFAADACALCCLQCTGVLALLLYMVQIGLWSWVFHQVYSTMPKTFAWEKLLRIYGSHYDDCVDRSLPNEIEMKPWSLCPNNYTMPCVPILAIILLIVNLFSGSSCLSKPKSKRMYTMVASSTTWQFLFTVIAITFTAFYFHKEIQVLEQDMLRDMSKGLPATSRWELTQAVQKCCGLKNFKGWLEYHNTTVTSFPESCYPNQLFFLCLATAIHGGARGNWNSQREHGVETNLGTADVYFISSPHHRYRHFHHRHTNANNAVVDDAESGGFHIHQTSGMVVSAADSAWDQH